MDSPDWLQFVTNSLDSSAEPEKPIAEKTEALLPPAFQPNRALLTPPTSTHGSPTDEADEPTIVSVSTTFYPGANLSSHPPDLVLLSADAVFFYVHSRRLLDASTNTFNSLMPEELLPPPDPTTPPVSSKDKDDVGPVLALPESSPVLNVLLHAIYGMSCVMYSPSIPTLVSAVSSLAKYGVPLDEYVRPATPLFDLFLSSAPAAPIEVYACAAEHNLHELADQVSPHLLNFPLFNISDADAQKMGPVYLKKMFFLHLGRVDALKRLLLPPPAGHAPTPQCGFQEQKRLTRAWALASAYLAWDARPDVSTVAIEGALSPLGDHLGCQLCKSALQERIKQLIVQWALVKRTI